MKSALITGISGQDGSYLAEILLEKGYKVYGLIRRSSAPNFWRIKHILDKVTILNGDLLDQGSIQRAIETAQPDEFYNLASQSFVPASWNEPEHTGEITGLGVARCLEAIRQVNKKIKFYQASSSEMFGNRITDHQGVVSLDEKTHLSPRSPYGCAKAYGHLMTVNYRESHGMFCVSGILFNHESPRRGTEFVTRKITKAAAMIVRCKQAKLKLGNMDAKRDWGHARDYMEAAWLMMQNDKAEDWVVGTGQAHSVRDLVCEAFTHAGLTDWEKYVEMDESLVRPAEINVLCANSSKAQLQLGWRPKSTFRGMISEMVESDIKMVDSGQDLG